MHDSGRQLRCQVFFLIFFRSVYYLDSCILAIWLVDDTSHSQPGGSARLPPAAASAAAAWRLRLAATALAASPLPSSAPGPPTCAAASRPHSELHYLRAWQPTALHRSAPVCTSLHRPLATLLLYLHLHLHCTCTEPALHMHLHLHCTCTCTCRCRWLRAPAGWRGVAWPAGRRAGLPPPYRRRHWASMCKCHFCKRQGQNWKIVWGQNSRVLGWKASKNRQAGWIGRFLKALAPNGAACKRPARFRGSHIVPLRLKALDVMPASLLDGGQPVVEAPGLTLATLPESPVTGKSRARE